MGSERDTMEASRNRLGCAACVSLLVLLLFLNLALHAQYPFDFSSPENGSALDLDDRSEESYAEARRAAASMLFVEARAGSERAGEVGGDE